MVSDEVDGFLTPEPPWILHPVMSWWLKAWPNAATGGQYPYRRGSGGGWLREMVAAPPVRDAVSGGGREIRPLAHGDRARRIRGEGDEEVGWLVGSVAGIKGAASACLLISLLPVASLGVARRGLPTGEGDDDPGSGGAAMAAGPWRGRAMRRR